MKRRWKKVALLGLLATGLAIGRLAYVYATEVPSGFQRVNFWKVSQDATYDENGRVISAPTWQALDGKAIFVKGYMYPEWERDRLISFVLLPEPGQCAFGRQPKQAELIQVNLPAGITTQFTDELVSVSGEFHVNDFSMSVELTSPFVLTARSVEPAKTSF